MSAPVAFAWLGEMERLSPQERARWDGALGRELRLEIDRCAREYEKAARRGLADDAWRVHRILVEVIGTWLRTGVPWALDPLRPPDSVQATERRRAVREVWDGHAPDVKAGLLEVWCRIEQHLPSEGDPHPGGGAR